MSSQTFWKTEPPGGSNARHHPPRIQLNSHPSLAEESNAMRSPVHAVVRMYAPENHVLDIFRSAHIADSPFK